MPNFVKNREILRNLARQVAEIAALPRQQQTISLWKSLNSLKPARPMVIIDQVPWHEMDVDGELTPQTDDEFCRQLETRLRRKLYAWKHMPADMVVEPVIVMPKVIRNADFGLRRHEDISVLDPQNEVTGHYYIDQMPNEEDIEKIKYPDPVLDEKATADLETRTREIFDGILEVRMEGMQPWFCPWDQIVQWRNVEAVLWDLADRPDFMRRMVNRLADAHQHLLNKLESRGLLCRPQSYIHCTGGFSGELPAPGSDPHRPQARDIWTAGMAQIFSAVSPAMHDEFEIPHARRWYARFGLGYYGCCEPLDDKIDLVRKIPNVRKISMSPWVTVEKGAERIGHDYVFSRKPSPAFLAVDNWDANAVAKDLQHTLDCCARHGCPVELILKDISTVRYQPQRIWEWAALSRKLVGGA